MALWQQNYPYSRFRPKKGHSEFSHRWHVWNTEGACEVLETGEYKTWLAERPERGYTINFANSSAARIQPEDMLWELLKAIAVDYIVEVFPLSLFAEYVPWTGAVNDHRAFDAICIWLKPVESAQ